VNKGLARRLFAVKSVPAHVVAMTAATSFALQLFAVLQGWPLWAIGLVTLLPWVPLLGLETAWTWRHYGMLALFFVLVVSQIGHFTEHIVQIGQLHVLDKPLAESRGIFGQLDIEWVHFGFNTWIIIATVALLWYFRRNPWLWALLAIAVWHEVEHVAIMSVFLDTGKAGDPGLLARGGDIGGGLDIARPDLHFFYNVVETVPLLAGFVYTLKHTYDEWLARALPALSEPMLVEATNRLQTLRFKPGDVIVRQGEAADRFYVVSRGEVGVFRRDDGADERELATLGAGQFFGEIGLLADLPRTASVRASSDVELLAIDRELFRRIVDSSEATADDLAEIVRVRLAAAPR
jgi:hypothetical protein